MPSQIKMLENIQPSQMEIPSQLLLKWSICSTAIPRDTLPLDMLTPQIRHYELRQKNSRYANFSDLSTPSYAIF